MFMYFVIFKNRNIKIKNKVKLKNITPNASAIVAVKVFRTITHNTQIIARAMLIHVYTLMECPSAWCKNKMRAKNFYRDNI